MMFTGVFVALSVALLVLATPEPEIIEEKRQGAYRMRSMCNSLTHIYKVVPVPVIDPPTIDVPTPGEFH